MPVILKQSTAVVVSFGPFVDKTDGVTFEIALAGTGANQLENTTTGLRISKNGGALAARHATATASTYDALGMYLVTLDTTDTATLGQLRMAMNNNDAVPVWQDFMVVTANIWDSLFSTDVLDTSLVQLLGTAMHTPALAGVPYVDVHNWLGAAAPALTGDPYAEAVAMHVHVDKIPQSDGTVSFNSTALAAINAEVDTALNTAVPGSPTANSINERVVALDDHITADYGSTEKAAIDLLDDANGLVNIHDTLDTVAGYLDTEIAAILADTNELQTDWVNGGRLDLILDIIAADTTTDIPALIPTAAQVADAVWDEVLDTAHEVSGSASVLLQAAGGAADPWLTPIPGAYGAGTAGKILGDNINAPIATVDTVVDSILTDTNAIHVHAQAIIDDLALVHTHVGTIDGHITADYGATEKAAIDLLDDANGLVNIHDTVDTVAGYVDTEVAALVSELAKVPKSDSNVTWNATALASINAEVDGALNTAIPGSPTSDSINERVKAIDDLTQASGAGDLAAILIDTGTTLDGKENQIIAAVITNAAGVDVAADIIALKAETAEILTDTGTTLDGKINTIDGIVDDILVDTGTTLDGKINTIDTVVDLVEDILRNKIEVTDANGNTVLYDDAGSTPLFSVAACLTDDSTTTIRKRLA